MDFLEQKAHEKAVQERMEAFEERQKQKKKDEADRKLEVYYAGIQAKREETRLEVENFQNSQLLNSAAATAVAVNAKIELQENKQEEQQKNIDLIAKKEKDKEDNKDKTTKDNKAKMDARNTSKAELDARLKGQEADRQAKLRAVSDQKEQYRLERERTRERGREQQRLEQQRIAEQSIHQTRNNMQELAAMAKEQQDRLMGLQRSFTAPVATKITTNSSAKDNAPSRPKRHSTYVNATNKAGRREPNYDDANSSSDDVDNDHARRSTAPNNNLGGSLSALVDHRVGGIGDDSSSSSNQMRRPQRHSTYIKPNKALSRMQRQQQPDMDWSDKHHVKIATKRASMVAAMPTSTSTSMSTTAMPMPVPMHDYSEQMDFGDDSSRKSNINSNRNNSSSSKKRVGAGSNRRGVQRQRSSSLSDMKRNRATTSSSTTTFISTGKNKAPDFNWSSFQESSDAKSKSPKSNRRSTMAVVAPGAGGRRGGGLTRNRSSSLSEMKNKGRGRNVDDKGQDTTKSSSSHRGRSKSVGRGRSRSRSHSHSSRKDSTTTTTTKTKSLLDSGIKTPSSRRGVTRQRSSSLSELKKNGHRSGSRRDRSVSVRSQRKSTKDKPSSKENKESKKKSDKEMDGSGKRKSKDAPSPPKRGVNRQRSSSLSGLRVSRTPSTSTSTSKSKADKTGRNDDNNEEGPNPFFDWIAHSQDAIGRLESQKVGLEERRKQKKEKRKALQKLEAQSRAKDKNKSKSKDSFGMDDSSNSSSRKSNRRRGSTGSVSSKGKKEPGSDRPILSEKETKASGSQETAATSKSSNSISEKEIPESTLESPPSSDSSQARTKKQSGEDIMPSPRISPIKTETTKPAAPTTMGASTNSAQNQETSSQPPEIDRSKDPGHPSSSDASMDVSKNEMDASTKHKDASRRRGSIFAKVFKKGESIPASSSLDTTDPSIDTSEENMDSSAMSAIGKDTSRRKGSIFGKAVKNAKAFIHRPPGAKNAKNTEDTADFKDEKAKATALALSGADAKTNISKAATKSMDVDPKPIKKKAAETTKKAKVTPTSMDVKLNPKPPKNKLALAADTVTQTENQTKKANLKSAAEDTKVAGKEEKAGASTDDAKAINMTEKNKVSSTAATTEAAKTKKKSNQPKGKQGNPSTTQGAPPRGITNAKSAAPDTVAPKRGVPRQRSSSLTDMVRGKIRAGLKPKPRESVMQFVPTAPKSIDFVEDDYEESPLRQLDVFEDELTLEQIRQKVAKLEKQLKDTEDLEAREVEEVVQSGRDVFEKVAEKAGQVSDLPNDTSQVDNAVRRNNEIIKYLKTENQKRREEQKKIKTSFFDLHQSTMRLEKETEQTLGFLEQLEDVHYQRELDKRTSLLRGLAACREGDEKLSEELQRRISYVEFELWVRQMYEERMSKLLLAFDVKYRGTPLSTLLHGIAAGKHDEQLEAVIRQEKKQEANSNEGKHGERSEAVTRQDNIPEANSNEEKHDEHFEATVRAENMHAANLTGEEQ